MKKIFEIATAAFFCFVAIERAFAGEFFTAILCVMIIVNLAADQQTEEVLKMYKKAHQISGIQKQVSLRQDQ
jgi:hypothetical protein